MADRKPEVGDPVVVDSQDWTVLAVEPDGKPVVKFGDEDAAKRDDRVAAIRAEYAGQEAEFAERWVDWKADRAAVKNMPTDTPELRKEKRQAEAEVNKTRSMLALEEEVVRNEMMERLEGVPRGVTVSVNVEDLVYVESGSCVTHRADDGNYETRDVADVWSVPGRLNAAEVPGRGGQPAAVPHSLRRQEELSTAHRARKGE